MYVEVEVPGSCGELMQGTEGGKPFLVTCPINRYTRVVVSDKIKGIEGLGEKARMALEKTLALFNIDDFSYGIKLESKLPQGKGMASSSADIAAVCLAAAYALGKEIDESTISRIATEIEPTDGIFFAGIVKINHVSGECLKHYGAMPYLSVAIFDTGGVVDTLLFHERHDLSQLNRYNEEKLLKALRLLELADEEAIVKAATCSALANQNILYKEKLDEVAATARTLGALGLNVAHSGTVLGIVFPSDTREIMIDKAVKQIEADFSGLEFLYLVKLIPGGYSVKIGD